MVFAKSITRYLLLRVLFSLEQQTERAAIGRNCRGEYEEKTRRAKDRKRQTHSYQRRTLVKRLTKRIENLSKEIFWSLDNTLLVKEFDLLLARPWYISLVYMNVQMHAIRYFFKQIISNIDNEKTYNAWAMILSISDIKSVNNNNNNFYTRES